MARHFLKDDDITAAEQAEILRRALELKKAPYSVRPFEGPKTVALIFDKTSTRTRVSFAVGVADLGGAPLIIDSQTSQMGGKESVADTARVLGRQVAQIVWRTYAHSGLEEMAANAGVPVINSLSDDYHPCQILADLMTIEEHRGPIAGKTIAWVGDGNNVCHSFMHAAPKLGFHLQVACPADYHPDLHDLARGGNHVTLTGDPRASNQAILAIMSAGVSRGAEPGEASGTQGLEFMAELNKAGNFVPVTGKSGTMAQGQTPIIAAWDYNLLAWRDQLAGNPPVEVIIPEGPVLADSPREAVTAAIRLGSQARRQR